MRSSYTSAKTSHVSYTRPIHIWRVVYSCMRRDSFYMTRRDSFLTGRDSEDATQKRWIVPMWSDSFLVGRDSFLTRRDSIFAARYGSPREKGVERENERGTSHGPHETWLIPHETWLRGRDISSEDVTHSCMRIDSLMYTTWSCIRHRVTRSWLSLLRSPSLSDTLAHTHTLIKHTYKHTCGMAEVVLLLGLISVCAMIWKD